MVQLAQTMLGGRLAHNMEQTAISTARNVDTTTGMNGYPERLRVAITADTMGELRELKDRHEAQGDTVEIIRLHRRDGWALWERDHDVDLDDERWMGTAPDEWTIDLTPDSDGMDEAFTLLIGEDGSDITTAKGLERAAGAVEALGKELDSLIDDLEDGQICRVWIDMDNRAVDYSVRTGQNGYSYDTHHYKSALLITEREAEDNDE